MLYLTCTMISSVDLARYRVSRAKDWVSVDCGTSTLFVYICSFSIQTVQLFGNILAGNFEGACFRYLMLLCDFVCAVDWKEVEDFRAFAAVVYPFLGVRIYLLLRGKLGW